jgi:hypothetical protein
MAVANYRQTALQVFEDVEGPLSMLNVLDAAIQSQRLARIAADHSLQLSWGRFNAGAISYSDIVTTQAIALENARMLERFEARRVAATVRLLTTLGGRWDRTQLVSYLSGQWLALVIVLSDVGQKMELSSEDLVSVSRQRSAILASRNLVFAVQPYAL